jgi:hypothetical protein
MEIADDQVEPIVRFDPELAAFEALTGAQPLQEYAPRRRTIIVCR